MLEGTLIAESLRVGTTLADLNLIARKSAGTGPVARHPISPISGRRLISKPTTATRGNWRRYLPGCLLSPAGT